MKRQLLLIATLIATSLTLPAADSKSDHSTDLSTAFLRLKTLVGEWEADLKPGKAHLTYELVSGGTALLERETAEGQPAMLTLYHMDGARLLLTHYCMAGNQPRMQAQSFNSDTGELDFQFLDATNLPSPGAGHMHSAKIHLVDHNHMVSEWQFYENGKPKFTETAQYTRIQ